MTILNLRRLENDETDTFNLNHALSGDPTDQASFISQSKIPAVKVIFD